MNASVSLNVKTLLVLGGTPQHLKLVEAARSMGARTIVVDCLNDSITKRAADQSYKIDIKDIDALVRMARKERVDGIVSAYIDPCQIPYFELCARLGLPCYGSFEQFRIMTDKAIFRDYCIEHNVDVVSAYTVDDCETKNVEFPLFVKPVDSRGSRGQTVCHNFSELQGAFERAKNESVRGTFLVERYMRGAPEFQVTYFFVDGVPYLIRTADSYTGSEKNGLEKVVLGAISPSRFTELYLERAHDNVVSMFKAMGYRNGPAFMQGFVDGDQFRFFDPGLRFPGVDYERIYEKVFGTSLAEALVYFALEGQMPRMELPEDGVNLKGKCAAVLFPTIKPGVVHDVSCLNRVSELDYVVSCLPRVTKGDKVEHRLDVNQRLAEIDLLAQNTLDLVEKVRKVDRMLVPLGAGGVNMILESFDASCL